MTQLHRTLPGKALFTSLGGSWHTVWPQCGGPACPLTLSNDTFCTIPTTSLDLTQHLCIQLENGDPLPSNLHPSLTRLPSLLLRPVHTQKDEDTGKNRCPISLFISKELNFCFLIVPLQLFRNGTPMSYAEHFRDSVVFKDGHNLLD